MTIRLFAIVAILVGFFLIVKAVFADHNGPYLPLVPNTPAIQNLLQDGERTWCVNAAANNYPGFVNQLQQTYDSQQAKLGNSNRKIAGTYESGTAALNAGCDVLHFGRYDSFCSGCAANVYYAQWPVQVNYKLSLGYTDWKSASGHEEGHIHGLHEQYMDGVTIGCDAGFAAMVDRLGFATVMSCGTGVWELQSQDVTWICDLYGVPGDRFHACAPAPVEEWGPCFDGGQFGFFGSCYQHNRLYNRWFWWGITNIKGEEWWTWSDSQPVWNCILNCPGR